MKNTYFPRVVRYRFETEVLTPIELPDFPGSTWRGLLGTSLRRTACLTHQPNCEGCLLMHSCAFFAFFEVPGKLTTGESRGISPSHPFVLELAPDGGRTVYPGEILWLGINLIGDANVYLPHLIYAVDRAGSTGVGKGRGQFRLRRVLQEVTLSREDWTQIFNADPGTLTPFDTGPVPLPDRPGSLQVDLITPLRIKRFGHFIGAREFTAADFLRHLCWRLDNLDQSFSPATPQSFWQRHRSLVERLNPCDTDVRWRDWSRYSSRQATTMKLGGLVGTCTLPQEAISAMWPLLWLGQWVHVGKATTFGLGAYRLRPAP